MAEIIIILCKKETSNSWT